MNFAVSDPGHSLSIGLQLADLKEHHQIIFTVAGSCLRASYRCQLGGRYCFEKGDRESYKLLVWVYREQTSGYQQGAENSSNPTEEREREEKRKSVM